MSLTVRACVYFAIPLTFLFVSVKFSRLKGNSPKSNFFLSLSLRVCVCVWGGGGGCGCVCVCVCKVGIGNRENSRIVLDKKGILTLSGEVGIPTWHGSIPESSLRKVGIGTN